MFLLPEYTRNTIVIPYQIRTLSFFTQTTSKEEYKNPFSSWCIIESWRACILSNLNSAKTIISNEDLELLCNLATLQVVYTMSLNVIDHSKRVKYFGDKARWIGSIISLVQSRRFNPSICLEYLVGWDNDTMRSTKIHLQHLQKVFCTSCRYSPSSTAVLKRAGFFHIHYLKV